MRSGLPHCVRRSSKILMQYELLQTSSAQLLRASLSMSPDTIIFVKHSDSPSESGLTETPPLEDVGMKLVKGMLEGVEKEPTHISARTRVIVA